MLTQARERFCLIGGLAVQRWGEPRVTRDVDLTLLCPFGHEAAAADLLLSEFKPRMADARQFAFRNRVLLLQAGDGIGIDVALGSLPFEARCVQRASDWEIAPGVVLRTCSAEDLVVLKAFAGRPRDWIDLEAVLLRQRATLDWTQVFGELEPLIGLAEAPEKLDKLKALWRSVGKGA